MDKQMVASLLKEYRGLCKLSTQEVVQQLSIKGIALSEKTLYGYENGVSLPNVPTFIALCDIYGIQDIIGETERISPTVSVSVSDEWHDSQYEDFFNASSYEKILLLIKWGIPSFSGYESSFDAMMKTMLSMKQSKAQQALHEFADGLTEEQAVIALRVLKAALTEEGE